MFFKKQSAILGILRLDYNYPAALGDIDCPETFNYNVIYRVIPGLTFQMCQSGDITDTVKNNIKTAVLWLNDNEVSGITGDCGFMMNIQDIVCMYTNKPVFLSALIQLPMLVHSYKKTEKIAVLTANGDSLANMSSLLYDLCSFDINNDTFVIVGCEDVLGFDAVALGEKVDTKLVEPNIVKKVENLLASNPDIKCILLECTELPPYSDAIRYATELPVYDSITCSDFFMSGSIDNPRFGLNDWQNKWDKKQEVYKYGSNLSKKEKDTLVNKVTE